MHILEHAKDSWYTRTTSSVFFFLFKLGSSIFIGKFQESILLWQRKCEDALYSLLVLGTQRPMCHLASVAMARIIMKGDGISIYSRASSLQGFLSDGKKSEPLRVAGWSRSFQVLDRYMQVPCISYVPFFPQVDQFVVL